MPALLCSEQEFWQAIHKMEIGLNFTLNDGEIKELKLLAKLMPINDAVKIFLEQQF